MKIFGITSILCLSLLYPEVYLHPGIYGGKTAEEGQFPYHVALEICLAGVCFVACEAAILSPHWVVSAAHCIAEEEKNDFHIIAGVVNYTESNEFRQYISKNATVVHEDFKRGGTNDIALFRLETPLVFNERVQPVRLPSPNEVFIGEGVVTGWGETETEDPDLLQYQFFELGDNDTCVSLTRDTNYDPETNVCVITGNGKSTCYGDSGGPLVQNGTLIGILSWGSLPCGVGNPNVFTKVSKYVEWIKERVHDL